MRSDLRLLTRVIQLLAVTVFLYVPLLFGDLLLRGSPGRRGAWRARLLQLWSGIACRIIGLRADIVGDPPREAGLFVCNHLSYVDVVLIASAMPAAFVAKREVLEWPVIGHLTRMTGTVFVDRGRHRTLVSANDEIAAELSAGRSVVVFAEGTSTPGETVEPFRPSLLKIACDFGYPVSFGYLSYQIGVDEADRQRTREQICWWGDADFLPHFINLLRIRSFSARLVFGDAPVVARERKVLATRLHQAVLQQAAKYSWL